MSAAAVVEDLDVFEDVAACGVAGRENVISVELFLRRGARAKAKKRCQIGRSALKVVKTAVPARKGESPDSQSELSGAAWSRG